MEGEKERERERERKREKSAMSREAAEGSGRCNEQWGYPGTYDSTEQAVKKAVALKASSGEE